jgi:hypothetical protein
VPAPRLEVQTVAATTAPSAPRAVQRVVAKTVASVATAGLPEPAVAPTTLAPREREPASPIPATRTAPPGWPLQRTTATTTTTATALVGTRPSVPDVPRAAAYDPVPTGVRSMPLQRLFSATSPPARQELPTRATGPAPDPAGSDSTEVAIHWEQPQATLQRAEQTSAEAGGPEPPAAEGVATALATTSPAPAKPGGTDLDELARRLYAPMSALLRAELWLDRERSGRSLTR